MNKNIKITVQNITRLSEDFLYKAIEDLPETHPDYHLIDAELTRRGALLVQSLVTLRESQLEAERTLLRVKNEIEEIFKNYKSGRRRTILIEKLGSEFVNDYEVCLETFTVVSLVARPDQQDVHSFTNVRDTMNKFTQLVYYRIYDKFMREPSSTNLTLVRTALGA
jgi:hypothetical protein